MIVIMDATASDGEVADVVHRLTEAGCLVRRSGMERTVLAVSGAGFEPSAELVEGLPGVAQISATSDGGHLVSREFQPRSTEIDVGSGVVIGGSDVVVIAGPCSVTDRERLHAIAHGVARAGARILRGGAYKPRTSPYSFQGIGEEGLYWLREAADTHGLRVVSEVMEPSQIHLAAHYCDLLQVGARNMQNFSLLRELGRSRRPVLLKRGPGATVEELLAAAEYLAACGNTDIVLCERGIRTFETATRNTLDLNAVPTLKVRSHLPVAVDPSHGTGRRDYVAAMARAAVAAGADAVMVEVDVDPNTAVSDGAQTLDVSEFEMLMDQLARVAQAVGRPLSRRQARAVP